MGLLVHLVHPGSRHRPGIAKSSRLQYRPSNDNYQRWRDKPVSRSDLQWLLLFFAACVAAGAAITTVIVILPKG